MEESLEKIHISVKEGVISSRKHMKFTENFKCGLPILNLNEIRHAVSEISGLTNDLTLSVHFM
jgi:hypothetical protein